MEMKFRDVLKKKDMEAQLRLFATIEDMCGIAQQTWLPQLKYDDESKSVLRVSVLSNILKSLDVVEG